MRSVTLDVGRAVELRALARPEPNAPARVRLLGVANVLGGLAIEPAAQAVGAGRATLDGWLGRYRAEGWRACATDPRAAGRSCSRRGRTPRPRPGSGSGRTTPGTG